MDVLLDIVYFLLYCFGWLIPIFAMAKWEEYKARKQLKAEGKWD